MMRIFKTEIYAATVFVSFVLFVAFVSTAFRVDNVNQTAGITQPELDVATNSAVANATNLSVAEVELATNQVEATAVGIATNIFTPAKAFFVSFTNDASTPPDAFTNLVFGFENIDPLNIHSNGNFVFTDIGWWNVSISVRMKEMGTEAFVELHARTNNAFYFVVDETTTPPTGNTNITVGASVPFRVDDTNIVYTLHLRHNDTQSRSIEGRVGVILTRASGFFIGP